MSLHAPLTASCPCSSILGWYTNLRMLSMSSRHSEPMQVFNRLCPLQGTKLSETLTDVLNKKSMWCLKCLSQLLLHGIPLSFHPRAQLTITLMIWTLFSELSWHLVLFSICKWHPTSSYMDTTASACLTKSSAFQRATFVSPYKCYIISTSFVTVTVSLCSLIYGSMTWIRSHPLLLPKS